MAILFYFGHLVLCHLALSIQPSVPTQFMAFGYLYRACFSAHVYCLWPIKKIMNCQSRQICPRYLLFYGLVFDPGSRLSISGTNHVGPPLPPGSSRGLQPPPVPHPNGQQQHTNGQPPQLQPRNPKVSVPMLSPNLMKSGEGELASFGGAKPRFIASSPNKVKHNKVKHNLK